MVVVVTRNPTRYGAPGGRSSKGAPPAPPISSVAVGTGGGGGAPTRHTSIPEKCAPPREAFSSIVSSVTSTGQGPNRSQRPGAVVKLDCTAFPLSRRSNVAGSPSSQT